jgi:anti-sigma28 factor (negative regulator of flagellin synthesis)
MKINDQGFTERLPGSQTSRSHSVSNSGYGSSSSSVSSKTNSDNLQLSSLASRLQDTSAMDASRAARVSEIAKAVSSNTLRIDTARISSAIVSEAVQTAGA